MKPRAGARAGVSDREAAVLDLVGAHLGNAQVGRRLAFSVRTEGSHVSSLLRKLDVALCDVLAGSGPSFERGAELEVSSPGRGVEREAVA